MLKQFVSEFYFSFISHVRASEIKLFISCCARRFRKSPVGCIPGSAPGPAVTDNNDGAGGDVAAIAGVKQ